MISLRNMKVANALLFFTYLGNWEVIVGLSVVAIIILGFFRKKREIIFLITALVVGEITGSLLKLFLHRQRPDKAFAILISNGYSFPSGHALMSVIFYGAICYFVYEASQKKWQRILSFIFFGTVIFIIGFSRIYLGAHWFFDIIAGWLIGFLILGFLYKFFTN